MPLLILLSKYNTIFHSNNRIQFVTSRKVRENIYGTEQTVMSKMSYDIIVKKKGSKQKKFSFFTAQNKII